MRLWVYSQIQVMPPPDAPPGTPPHVFNNGTGVETREDITDFPMVEPGLAEAVKQAISVKVQIPVEMLLVNILGWTVIPEKLVLVPGDRGFRK